MIVLTKCDVDVEEFSFKKYFDTGAVQQRALDFKAKINLGKRVLVYPFVNCTGPRVFDKRYCLLSLNLLHDTMRKAHTYIKKLWRWHLRVIDPL